MGLGGQFYAPFGHHVFSHTGGFGFLKGLYFESEAFEVSFCPVDLWIEGLEPGES
jgi:hypothetical protein